MALVFIKRNGENMNPKEALRNKMRQTVDDLPDSCRDDFYRLLSLLTRYNEQAEERKIAYETWVASLFEEYRNEGLCCFCGTPVTPAATDEPVYFCSDKCRDEWKHHVMLALTAYL
jgi:hypothetical protein